MKLQLLSDLHLETEAFEPQPAPGAELLVLAGDIDTTWQGLQRFAGWPVPVIFVPGNHEFDGRDVDRVVPELREACAALGIRLLHRECAYLTGADGRSLRLVATTRWSDFDVFGPGERLRAQRAAGYFVRLMQATQRGLPFDVAAVRAEGLACRAWLAEALNALPSGAVGGAAPADTAADTGVQVAAPATVVITHFAPSLRSADPRYGRQPGTASFCNADDDLLVAADLWLHGHVHCRHDYTVPRPGRPATRVVCQARGLARKGEAEGFDAFKLIEV